MPDRNKKNTISYVINAYCNIILLLYRRCENPVIHRSELTEHQISLSQRYLPTLTDLDAVKSEMEEVKKTMYIMVS